MQAKSLGLVELLDDYGATPDNPDVYVGDYRYIEQSDEGIPIVAWLGFTGGEVDLISRALVARLDVMNLDGDDVTLATLRALASVAAEHLPDYVLAQIGAVAS